MNLCVCECHLQVRSHSWGRWCAVVVADCWWHPYPRSTQTNTQWERGFQERLERTFGNGYGRCRQITTSGSNIAGFTRFSRPDRSDGRVVEGFGRCCARTRICNPIGEEENKKKKKEKHVEKAIVEIVYDRSQRDGGWAQIQPHRTPEHVHCACVSATNTRRMRLNARFDPLSLFSVFLCVPKKVLEDGLYLQKGVEVCVCVYVRGVIYTPDTNQGGEIT